MDELIVISKFPQEGRVKTRLGKDIGYDKSAYLARCLLEDIISTASNVCKVSIASCADDVQMFREHYPDYSIYPSTENSLIPKLCDSIREIYANGCGKVIAVTSDLFIDEKELHSWFKDLDDHNLLIGPTYDLMFYLFGSDHRLGSIADSYLSKRMLGGSLISSLLKESRQTGRIFPRFRILPFKRDIDTLNDLRKLSGCIPESYKKTSQFMQSLKNYL